MKLFHPFLFHRTVFTNGVPNTPTHHPLVHTLSHEATLSVTKLRSQLTYQMTADTSDNEERRNQVFRRSQYSSMKEGVSLKSQFCVATRSSLRNQQGLYTSLIRQGTWRHARTSFAPPYVTCISSTLRG